MIDSALLGILRHLPANLLGDLAQIKKDLDFESPLENIKDALEDVAESVAEIAAVTRGFTSKTKTEQSEGWGNAQDAVLIMSSVRIKKIPSRLTLPFSAD